MANERITENIVRDLLGRHGYYTDESITVAEQSSEAPKINKLLKHASKKGSGKGYPEFIITSEEYPDLVCVIECKAEASKHASQKLDKYAEYAVDGARLYASYLSKEYDVLFIGASGQHKGEFRASHYLQLSGKKETEPILGEKILPFGDCIAAYKDESFRRDYSNLIAYLGRLNEALQHHKVPEDKRAILFSGILIALEDASFRESYTSYSDPARLGDLLVKSIIAKLEGANIEQNRVQDMQQSFAFIQSHTALIDDGYLVALLREVHHEVAKFTKSNRYFDILSRAYQEFLRYANNDAKLGIVLTPAHITELFCDLANLTPESVVYDNCCGTGGFLVAAMGKMIEQAKGDRAKIAAIKAEQLVGVEYQDHIYTLCCSNMILNGDGKTNIIKANCFNSVEAVKAYKPTVGLLNPPYKGAKDKKGVQELEFVLNNCEALEQNGLCVAIIPISCVLAQKGEQHRLKDRLLQQHTLEAVLSMPTDLFYPVGVVTAVVVIRAHQPHPQGYKTYFGYWKDDGFVKRKHKGRVDDQKKWQGIKEQWLSSYRNRESTPGLSITQEVSATDEWCAEAYMETDYSTLSEADFIEVVRNYIVFCFAQGYKDEVSRQSYISELPELNISKWEAFAVDSVFTQCNKGTRLTKQDRVEGDIPLVTAGKFNLGVKGFIDITQTGQILYQNRITIDMFCNVYLHSSKFACDDNVITLGNADLSVYAMLFLVSVISQDRYRYQYGRQYRMKHLAKHRIQLPVDERGEPDWQFMEDYIKALPYSGNL